MNFPESSGEEWKTGTEYEDPERRALRMLAEGFAALGIKVEAFGRSLTNMGTIIQVEIGIKHLIAAGVSPDRARGVIQSTAARVRAEGKSLPRAIANLIVEVESDPEHPLLQAQDLDLPGE